MNLAVVVLHHLNKLRKDFRNMSNFLDKMHQFHDNLVHGLSFVVENFRFRIAS